MKECYCLAGVINGENVMRFFTQAQEWHSWHLKNM